MLGSVSCNLRLLEDLVLVTAGTETSKRLVKGTTLLAGFILWRAEKFVTSSEYSLHGDEYHKSVFVKPLFAERVKKSQLIE